jgi:hypothetical protein
MSQDAFTLEFEKKESLQEMSQSKLDYWLMKNIKIMEELSVEEQSSWMEADTPG